MERRKIPTPEYARTIALAVREEISSLTIPEETHRRHHDYIDQWIAKQQRKEARWEAIQTQAGGWGVIAFLGACGTGAWMLFKIVVVSIPK